MGNEREQDGWLGNTLRHSPATVSEACLDAETLAAWADGGLSAKAAADVELHASSCARCMAVVATMERTAPAAPATHAWTPARLVRWLVPLTAAATAAAIWIAVPDRTFNPVPPPAHVLEESRESSARTDAPVPVPERGTSNVELGPSNLEPGTRNPEPPRLNQNQELGTRNPEPGTRNLEPDDQLRREGFAPEPLGALADAAREAPPPPAAAPPPATPAPSPAPASETAGARARALASPPPPPVAAPPPAQASQAPSAPVPAPPADSLAESVAIDRSVQQRSAFASKINVTSQSAVPTNKLFQWRVIGNLEIERSIDGGRTWTKTVPVPGVKPGAANSLAIVSIRAVSDVAAFARTSDGRDFYTSNGGTSWVPPPQEK